MLRRQLGDCPSDPSCEYRRLSEEFAQEKHYREGAQWRLNTARKSRADLGPIGRRTHRSQRRELERRIDGFEGDIARHDSKLADLEAKLTELTPDMLTWATWEREHSTELSRIDALERQITWNEGIERVVTRELERGLDRGTDRGLGIEL